MTGKVSNDLKVIYPALRYMLYLIKPEAVWLLLYHTSLSEGKTSSAEFKKCNHYR